MLQNFLWALQKQFQMDEEYYLKGRKTDQSWAERNPGDVHQTERFFTGLGSAGPSTACVGSSRSFQRLIQVKSCSNRAAGIVCLYACSAGPSVFYFARLFGLELRLCLCFSKFYCQMALLFQIQAGRYLGRQFHSQSKEKVMHHTEHKTSIFPNKSSCYSKI